MYATTEDLLRIREACLAVAIESREAAPEEDREQDLGRSPLSGCCGAVAIMLQRCFGGTILKGQVDGCNHYWNRLRCGRVVDLTSCQFGGDGMHALIDGHVVDAPDLVDPRYLHFAWLVYQRLFGSYAELETALPPA